MSLPVYLVDKFCLHLFHYCFLPPLSQFYPPPPAAVKPPPATVKFAVRMRVGDIIAMAVGVAGGLVLVAVLVCALVRMRAARREGGGGKREEAGASEGSSQSSVGELAGKDIPPPPAPPRDFDEKNPDVIPLSGKPVTSALRHSVS